MKLRFMAFLVWGIFFHALFICNSSFANEKTDLKPIVACSDCDDE